MKTLVVGFTILGMLGTCACGTRSEPAPAAQAPTPRPPTPVSDVSPSQTAPGPAGQPTQTPPPAGGMASGATAAVPSAAPPGAPTTTAMPAPAIPATDSAAGPASAAAPPPSSGVPPGMVGMLGSALGGGLGAPPQSSSQPPAPAAASGEPAPAAVPATAAAPDSGAPVPSPPHEAFSPPVPTGPPAKTTTINVAAEAVGGEVEALTGQVGPGFSGRKLIDGMTARTWKLAAPVTYPQEAVFSFFERQPALVSEVDVVLPDDASLAPRDVEVWTSAADTPDAGFVQVAQSTLEARPGTQTIAFPAMNARFVKLRVLSGASPKGLEIGDVRVLEAARDGYGALFTRRPDATSWHGSPREAGQLGLDWLQQAASDWPKQNLCFGATSSRRPSWARPSP